MNLLQALGQAIRIPELRRKLLFTLGLLLVFRVLASVSVPGANPQALQQLFANNSLLGLLNLFSGGGLSTFSIAAMGMNPYINATIIMQLMTVVLPAPQGDVQGGRAGTPEDHPLHPLAHRRAREPAGVRLHRALTSQGVLSSPSAGTVISIILTLTSGSIILMWLGELITEYGVGNGVSLVIFSGIIGRLPGALYAYGTTGGTAHVLQLLVMAVVAISVTAFIIEVQQAQRKIPIQSAQRVVNPRAGQAVQGRRSFLPLRVNAGGVIPIIFAISIMAFPTIFANFFQNAGGVAGRLAHWISGNWQPNGPSLLANVAYNGIEFMLVLGFTYFYTAVVFDPNDVADDFKKRSVYIPGIRPGKWTADYLGKVMGRITLAGALFLAVITVVLPLGTSSATGVSTTSLYLGGTAILIVVGVALDTMQQIETQLLMRQYKGFIK